MWKGLALFRHWDKKTCCALLFNGLWTKWLHALLKAVFGRMLQLPQAWRLTSRQCIPKVHGTGGPAGGPTSHCRYTSVLSGGFHSLGRPEKCVPP